MVSQIECTVIRHGLCWSRCEEKLGDGEACSIEPCDERNDVSFALKVLMKDVGCRIETNTKERRMRVGARSGVRVRVRVQGAG